jgi:RHS repeat-associated protein
VCASHVCFPPCHFTGKERDTESGNDYFGARYYSNAMGRMISPDPSGIASVDPSNPQSWNMYRRVDPVPVIFSKKVEGAPGPSLLGTGGKAHISLPSDSRLEYPCGV